MLSNFVFVVFVELYPLIPVSVTWTVVVFVLLLKLLYQWCRQKCTMYAEINEPPDGSPGLTVCVCLCLHVYMCVVCVVCMCVVCFVVCFVCVLCAMLCVCVMCYMLHVCVCRCVGDGPVPEHGYVRLFWKA